MSVILSIILFVGFGLVFVLASLLIGRMVRPCVPSDVKQSTYECGEQTVGRTWVQFDLRFYIVALFYLVFDVEVALIYPWAVSFRSFPTEALVLGLPFVALVVIGYAYEWYSGSLEWVRSQANTSAQASVGGGGSVGDGMEVTAGQMRTEAAS